MIPWKTLSRQTVFQCGKFLTVESRSIQLPDGRIIPDWTWLISPDFVIVVAQTLDGRFLCFRQTKYAVTGPCLAPVGGYIEPGEAPLQAAQRELLEEAGYASPDWTPLGAYAVDANRGNGTAHLFLARQCQRIAEPHSDDLEEQQLLFLSPAELQAATLAGEFKVVPWTAAIALALLRMQVPTANP